MIDDTMRLRALTAIVLAAAAASCASHREALAPFEVRVAPAESQVAPLSSGSSRAAAIPPNRTHFVFPVSVELGSAELYQGDSIEITEVLGTKPTMRSGGRYLVKGRYRLVSQSAARLILSVTSTERSAGAPSDPDSELRVERGEGEFALIKQLDAKGYPHLTFYERRGGKAFGGVYFGTGDWLLMDKGWLYRSAPYQTEPAEGGKPFQRL